MFPPHPLEKEARVPVAAEYLPPPNLPSSIFLYGLQHPSLSPSFHKSFRHWLRSYEGISVTNSWQARLCPLPRECLMWLNQPPKYGCTSSWCPPSSSPVDADSNEEDLAQATLSHMLTAPHKALLVFFYQRIREIRSSLAECDREDMPAVRQTAAFVWHAFPAGCEARDPVLQNCFTNWFEVSAAGERAADF